MANQRKLNGWLALFSFAVMVSLSACKPATTVDSNLGASDPTPEKLPSQMKVVVFATKCPLPTDCDSAYIEKAGADVAALKPDIVIATEFFWKKDNYVNFAKKVGLTYYSRGPGDSQDSVTGGVVLLSRYPFSSFKGDVFSKAVLPDSLVKKGSVLGKVRIGKTSAGKEIAVNLVGTHYQAISSGWIAAQTDQISQQARFIRDNFDSTAFTLFGGDFNNTQDIPDWMCSDADCRTGVTANWNRIVDQMVAPIRFLSASQVCAVGASVQSCINQSFAEIGDQRGEVLKLFVSNTPAFSSRGVVIVPRKIEAVQTISDHRTVVSTLQVSEL